VHVIGRLAASVAVITLVPIALLARQIATQPPDGMSRGRAVFERACSTCHIGDDPRVPSLDELRAKLVGLIQAPATKIAQVVNAPAAKVARVVQAYADKSEAA